MELSQTLHIITGLNDGGAEAVLHRLVTYNQPDLHHIVSLMGPGKYGPLLEEAGARVTCLGMPRGRITLLGLLRLYRLLRTEQPVVVQTWMYHGDLIGGVIARLAGIRNICWGIHTTTLEPGKSRRATIGVAKLNMRLSHWVPRRIVCCAEKAKAVHVSLGYAAEKMVVIPNGYDLAYFTPDPALREGLRAELRLADDTLLVGMVGRFDPQKDHANLIGALRILKERDVPLRCVLVGSGLDSSNAEFVSHINEAKLNDHIHLLGQRSDIPAVMNALDLHVLSSAYGEAFPNVLSEAMACGTPCVATDVGDAGVIIGETGWVVPPQNSEALAQGIYQALASRQHREGWQQRQQSCRERILANFSLDTMVAAYRKVWAGST